MTRSPRPELMGLLQTARESPGDVAPRLVVADWLEEHGDEVDRARAEFVRLQCRQEEEEAGYTPVSNRRELELHKQYYREWVGSVATLCRWGPNLADGFPHVRLNGTIFTD